MNTVDTNDNHNSNQNDGEYVVVARRYRPQAFDELVGQQHVATALSNAINTSRVATPICSRVRVELARRRWLEFLPRH